MKLLAPAFPCCRAHDLFDPVEPYANAIRRSIADEVYWFSWITQCSGAGSATIRVARLGNEAMVFRVYRSSTFGKTRRFHGALSRQDWLLIEDALLNANFWMLPQDEEEQVGLRGLLGGTSWGFAGRRRHDYHYISRRNPDGAFWELGRVLFDLAGLRDVRL